MKWARRMTDAYQLHLHEEGLLAPLEAMSRIYPRYGWLFQKDNPGFGLSSPDDIEMGIGSYFEAPVEVVEAVRETAHLTHQMTVPALSESIAVKFAEENDLRLDAASQVLVTGGGRSGIILSALAFIDPGDEVLVPDPDYLGLG